MYNLFIPPYIVFKTMFDLVWMRKGSQTTIACMVQKSIHMTDHFFWQLWHDTINNIKLYYLYEFQI